MKLTSMLKKRDQPHLSSTNDLMETSKKGNLKERQTSCVDTSEQACKLFDPRSSLNLLGEESIRQVSTSNEQSLLPSGDALCDKNLMGGHEM